MNHTASRAARPGRTTEHFDVLIAGAGISGVGGAYHLRRQCPDKSFVVLEAQESFGGTWLTHRYPGIRSDSDLYTFGYRFKPWTGAPIATAAEIRRYMGEVIEENGLDRFIRYRHRIERAAWSSEARLWTVEAVRTDTGEAVRFTAGFLYMCQGYYRHDEGYTPDWPGMAEFRGRIVHPQTWPAELEYRGRRVVVIGSGATAATVVPNIAGETAHVTMLQRSPTFFRTGRNAIELADELRRLQIDEAWIHEIVRKKILYEQSVFTSRSFTEPERVKQELLAGARHYLGPDYDIATHFTPSYRPWRQRIAFIPDGDLFQGIHDGKASVVTDEIERFEAAGIRLKSGGLLEADIIVTATGFHLSALGEIAFTIDGAALEFARTVTYRGMMFTGVPNLAWVFGYFRASWTLRADLVGDFVCRLLRHMDETGARQVNVALRPEDADMKLGPWIDPENFNPGYMMRGMHKLPRAGDKPEWAHTQDYWAEKDAFPAIDLTDAAFVYDAAQPGGTTMPKTLEDFAAECHAALAADPGRGGREKICAIVQEMIRTPGFVDRWIKEDGPERKIIYQDKEFGFCILAHNYQGAKDSSPHDHGPTWAIYAQATGETIMTDWEKLEPATETTPGKVRATRVYTLTPGMGYLYNEGDLHSPRRDASTRLIRVEGQDVSKIRRLKYVAVEAAPAK
jgi:cation diffusion facilitator CzcD-associated flavoprotein CzcO